MNAHLCPITLKDARAFILQHHRHNDPPHGHKFSIGLTDGGRLIGVVVVGHPIARRNCDGYTAEITRCCVSDRQKNANSKLYAAAIRAARAMGYRRMITYTLPEQADRTIIIAAMHASSFIIFATSSIQRSACISICCK